MAAFMGRRLLQVRPATGLGVRARAQERIGGESLRFGATSPAATGASRSRRHHAVFAVPACCRHDASGAQLHELA